VTVDFARRFLTLTGVYDPYPGIRYVYDPMGIRPALNGTGLDVWEVVETVQANDDSAAEAAAYLEIDLAIVETAMRYYESHRTEIDEWIRRVRDEADRAMLDYEQRRS
jgi:uncharacterized protein (DUF433 family)